ncbi:hypothetical protein GCM10020331_009710 [Ectobacillus funiculus]
MNKDRQWGGGDACSIWLWLVFSLEECANQFIRTVREFHPNEDNVKKTYKALFEIYKTVYEKHEKNINKMLKAFRG